MGNNDKYEFEVDFVRNSLMFGAHKFRTKDTYSEAIARASQIANEGLLIKYGEPGEKGRFRYIPATQIAVVVFNEL